MTYITTPSGHIIAQGETRQEALNIAADKYTTRGPFPVFSDDIVRWIDCGLLKEEES